MKKFTITPIFLILILFSCDQEENILLEENIEDSSIKSIYGLNIGNYWIYENLMYDGYTDTYIETGVIDSLIVFDTEIINNKTFYKIKTTTIGNENDHNLLNPNGEKITYQREHEGNLIRIKKAIAKEDIPIDLTADQYEDYKKRIEVESIIYKTNEFEKYFIYLNYPHNLYQELIETNKSITVKSGTFICYETIRYMILNEADDIIDNNYRSKATDLHYYSEGIGLIYSTLSYISQETSIIKTKLIKHRIN